MATDPRIQNRGGSKWRFPLFQRNMSSQEKNVAPRKTTENEQMINESKTASFGHHEHGTLGQMTTTTTTTTTTTATATSAMMANNPDYGNGRKLQNNFSSQPSTQVRPSAMSSTEKEKTTIKITQEYIVEKWNLGKVPQYQIDDKGYIHFEKGLLVNNRYVLKEALGRGTFSKVFESIDIMSGKHVALKVIRNSSRYIEAAKTELKILQHITNSDDGGSCCVHLREYFTWNDHPCLVFRLYGPSIYSIMSKNRYRPFPDDIVRHLSAQICTAIQFLHQRDIIFTDLKPENIVFVDGRTKEVTIPGNKVQYYPIDTRIKIIDFGSAVYEPKYDPNNKATWKFRDGYTYLIQTRHYRAPEVVLEMHWKRPVDIWSIGCVILEFLHGSMVFNTHCSIDHLNQMQAMIGPIPQKLIESASSQTMEEMFHLETLSLRMENAKRSRVQARSLEHYFDFKKPQHADLYDLVKRMLKWFAADRISAEDIVQHRYWITSAAPVKEQ